MLQLKSSPLRAAFNDRKYFEVLNYVHKAVVDYIEDIKTPNEMKAQIVKLLGSSAFLFENLDIYLLWSAACANEYLNMKKNAVQNQET